MSPFGSTNLTPLSGAGLWDAVIITPIVAGEKQLTNKHDYDMGKSHQWMFITTISSVT
jgi:hypothetical protein